MQRFLPLVALVLAALAGITMATSFVRDCVRARVTLEESTGVDRLLSVGRNGEFARVLMEGVYWRTLARTRELAFELRGDTSVRR